MSEFTKKLLYVSSLNDATRNLIDEGSAELFEALFRHMIEINEHLNLTAITDEDGVILKHFVDSVAISPFLPQGARIADIGCGGGFPTLPVAILRSDVSILGLDSVTKKVNYVRDTASFLGLNNVSVSNARAEALGQDKQHRESFDIVCARGVKSLSSESELSEAKNAISLLGGELERCYEYTLTNGLESLSRTIIIIKKATHTPPKYPRNNSQIAKKRL